MRIPNGDITPGNSTVPAGLKLSIVTICRNERKLIEETCRSVAEQKFDGFEWIVVDGASTDGTLDVLSRYRRYMSFFVSEADAGSHDALNKGIRHARGEYVFFLNGGDSLAGSSVLSRLFEYKADNPALRLMKPALASDIVFGETVVRETGFLLPRQAMPSAHRRLGLVYFRLYSPPQPAAFIKRSLFEKAGYYDASYVIAGDYEWFMRAILRWRARHEYVPLVVSIYNFEGVTSRAGFASNPLHMSERRRAYRKYVLDPAIVAREIIDGLKAAVVSWTLLFARLFLPPAFRSRLRSRIRP